MSNLISMYLPLFEVCLMYSHGRKNNSHMMYKGVGLYYVDEASHMSILVLLLHDFHFENARRQQESLLLWLHLGEYG